MIDNLMMVSKDHSADGRTKSVCGTTGEALGSQREWHKGQRNPTNEQRLFLLQGFVRGQLWEGQQR